MGLVGDGDGTAGGAGSLTKLETSSGERHLIKLTRDHATIAQTVRVRVSYYQSATRGLDYNIMVHVNAGEASYSAISEQVEFELYFAAGATETWETFQGNRYYVQVINDTTLDRLKTVDNPEPTELVPNPPLDEYDYSNEVANLQVVANSEIVSAGTASVTIVDDEKSMAGNRELYYWPDNKGTRYEVIPGHTAQDEVDWHGWVPIYEGESIVYWERLKTVYGWEPKNPTQNNFGFLAL